MKTLNHFFFSRGAVRVLAFALIAQLAFATAGLNKALAQTSGTTGDCSWALTGSPGDYTLTISGSGAMADYNGYPPWDSYKDDIKTLVIQDGVTAIGQRAFISCNKLTGTLTIPGSVETIGLQAFYSCYGFTGALEIPNSVTTIGDRAFEQCTGFTETLKIGTSVETIGSEAFKNCKNLTGELTIPNSVTTIRQLAFSGCSGFSGTLTIGNSVETIGFSAFVDCSGFTGVTIPASVTTIDQYTFSGCSGLKSVNIPASVSSIKQYAFLECTGLTDVTLNSATPPTVSSLGAVFYDVPLSNVTLHIPAGSEAAYAGWTGFGSTRIEIPSSTLEWAFSGGTLTVSGTGTIPSFYNASEQPWASHRNDITSVVIESGVTRIGDKAFADCSNLASVDIPASVDGIGMSAFEDCSALASITVDPDNTIYSSDATGVLFNKVQTRLIQYPAGNTGNSYTIPSTVSTVNDYAFANCTGLTDITVDWTSSPPTVDNAKVFENVNKGNITLHLPTGATQGDYEAAGWTGFKTYDIPTCPGPTAFGTGLTWELCSGTLTIDGTGAMPNFSDASNQPWNPHKDEITSVVIESGVETIGDCAFAECSALASVSIPASVTSIGKFAFNGCTGLTSVTIPASVTAINGGAFNSCSGLKSVTIPASVHTIGNIVFTDCTGLKSVTLLRTTSMSNFGAGVFAGCTGLTGITVNWTSAVDIPDISGKSVFDGVTPGDVTLYIAGGTGKSDYTAKGWPADFHYCTSGTFGATGRLTWTLCGGTLTIEGTDAMDDSLWSLYSADITDVIIMEGVTSIIENAFYECSNLVSVTIPSSVASIGEYAFYKCSNLASVTIPSSVASIGDYAFYDCDGLVSVDIQEGVASIGSSAFTRCPKLVSVTIPASVASIGELAFASYTSLETVNFAPSSSLAVIETAAFQFCTALTSITIPASVTEIHAFAFIGTGLQSITFESPSSLTTIESVSFQDCSALTSIDIPASVTAIGSYAFQSSGLQTVTVHWTSAGDIPDISSKDVFNGLPLPLSSTTLNVPAGTKALYEAKAVWKDFNIVEQAAATYTLTIGTFANGSVTAVKTAYSATEPVTLTVAPAAGYMLNDISAHKTDDAGTDVPLSGSGSTRTFTMPAHDVTVTASFKPDDQASVDAAKGIVEAAAYTVAQSAANTEAAVKTWLAARINALPGLSATGIDAVTVSDIAVIAITPAVTGGANGTFTFTVALRKGSATATTASRNGTITATPLVNAQTPVISRQPQSTTVDAGRSVTLTVTASVGDGGTLTYRWYRNTSNSVTGGTSIGGATGSSYSPSTSTAGTTWYYVVITNTNSSVNGTQTASVTSSAAYVTVNAIVVPPTTYAITVAPSSNGQVTANKARAEARETVTLTVTPAAGYELSTVTVHRTGSESVTVSVSGTGNTLTFVMPYHDVTVRATFTSATGTEVLPPSKALSARTQNGRLHVSGLTPGQPWRIYSLAGTLIRHSTADADEANVSLPSRGIYIVRSGERSIKVVY